MLIKETRQNSVMQLGLYNQVPVSPQSEKPVMESKCCSNADVFCVHITPYFCEAGLFDTDEYTRTKNVFMVTLSVIYLDRLVLMQSIDECITRYHHHASFISRNV